MHIIFDLDGTLLDTEFEVSRITAAVAAEKGCVITADEIFKRFSGWSASAKFEAIAKVCGVVLTAADISEMERKHEDEKRKHTLAGNSPALIEGVVEVLNSLAKAGHTMSLASSSPSTLSKPALDKAGLRHHFNDRVFGPDNSGGKLKPDPGVYLNAMASATDIPGRPVVVEDSVPGVMAGRAAGAFVIARLDPRFGYGTAAAAKMAELRKAGADAVINDYKWLEKVLPTQGKHNIKPAVPPIAP